MSTKLDGSLDKLTTEKILKDYNNDPKNNLVRHALSRHSVANVIFEAATSVNVSADFSVNLKTMPVANQKMSGRCWIFAGLNVLREIVAKKYRIPRFELSQNYISLFDKIEKSNFALETLASLADHEHDERVNDFILSNPVSDGGQWDMFVNLVKKYGVVPQNAFPETYQSNNTKELDMLVNAAIRHFACLAHKLVVNGEKEKIRALKDETMEKIYHMFLNAFGIPPTTFDFEYTDDKGVYHLERGLTPKVFFDTHIGQKIDEYQSIINYPETDKPFMKRYTIDHLGNVVEGKAISHLNLSMERMEELIIRQLADKEPVWFGSDVGFYRDRNSAAWDSEAFDYPSAFGFDIKFDKADMLYYRHSAMNHAMVIVGVNLVDGKPTKWKIENSWGEDNGVKGYYVMSSKWFDQFVYQAVILKKYLTKEELSVLKEEAIHLPPWDPMGTLA